MKINEDQWKSMKIDENRWKSMKINENLENQSEPMKINENHRKSMKIDPAKCFPDIPRYLKMPPDVCFLPWCLMLPYACMYLPHMFKISMTSPTAAPAQNGPSRRSLQMPVAWCFLPAWCLRHDASSTWLPKTTDCTRLLRQGLTKWPPWSRAYSNIQ